MANCFLYTLTTEYDAIVSYIKASKVKGIIQRDNALYHASGAIKQNLYDRVCKVFTWYQIDEYKTGRSSDKHVQGKPEFVEWARKWISAK